MLASHSNEDLCFLHHNYFTTIITINLPSVTEKARNGEFIRTWERSGPEAILSLPVLAGPLTQRGARASFPKVWESVIYKPNFSFFRVIQRNLRKLDTQYCVRTRNTQMLLQRALAPETVCTLASSVFPSDRCQQDTFHFQPEVWTLAIYRGTSYLS